MWPIVPPVLVDPWDWLIKPVMCLPKIKNCHLGKVQSTPTEDRSYRQWQEPPHLFTLQHFATQWVCWYATAWTRYDVSWRYVLSVEECTNLTGDKACGYQGAAIRARDDHSSMAPMSRWVWRWWTCGLEHQCPSWRHASDFPSYAVPLTPCSVLHSGRPPLVVVVEVLIVTFGITCTASCGGVWERLDWPFHPPIPRRLGYIVLVFCHVSE